MNDPMDCDKDGNAVTLADIFKDGTDVAEEAALNIELDKMYRYIDEELDEREKKYSQSVTVCLKHPTAPTG